MTVTSSLNFISPDQLRGVRRYSACLHPFLHQTSVQIFKDDVNGFSSASDISFMISGICVKYIDLAYTG